MYLSAIDIVDVLRVNNTTVISRVLTNMKLHLADFFFIGRQCWSMLILPSPHCRNPVGPCLKIDNVIGFWRTMLCNTPCLIVVLVLLVFYGHLTGGWGGVFEWFYYLCKSACCVAALHCCSVTGRGNGIIIFAMIMISLVFDGPLYFCWLTPICTVLLLFVGHLLSTVVGGIFEWYYYQWNCCATALLLHRWLLVV